jgi:hypothetical protein
MLTPAQPNGQMSDHLKAASWPGPRVEVPAQQQSPLAHPDDPVARPGQDGDTAAVVEHLDGDPAVVGVEPHLGPGAWPCVFERVGQCLLDDAVGGEAHASGEVDLFTVHRERGI